MAEEQGKHLCACGCGEKIRLRPQHFNIGVPKYVHGHNTPRGAANHLFKTGSALSSQGYRLVSGQSDHPFAFNGGMMLEHRLICEQHLRVSNPGSPFLISLDSGLYLDPACDVHHLDGNKLNNAPENLVAMTKKEHQAVHHVGVKRRR